MKTRTRSLVAAALCCAAGAVAPPLIAGVRPRFGIPGDPLPRVFDR